MVQQDEKLSPVIGVGQFRQGAIEASDARRNLQPNSASVRIIYPRAFYTELRKKHAIN